MSNHSMLINFNAISKNIRNKNLSIHYDHLRKIKIRKNSYVELNPPSLLKKPIKKPPNISFLRQSNLLYQSRLHNISNRQNKLLLDLSKSNDLITQRHTQKKKVNEILIKKINSDNNLMRKRVDDTHCEVNIKQFERQFKESRNFIKHMRKVKKDSQSSCDMIRFNNSSVVKFPFLK